MKRILRFLDSRPLSRAGAVATLVSLVSVGLALVGLIFARGAGLVREGEWITVVCFGVWAMLSALLIIAWIARRQPGTVVTPAARIAIAKGLPGSSRALLAALARAETEGREFIAEAAILMPVNNQKAAHDLAQGYAAFESEVSSVIKSSKVLDERWSLTWERKPDYFGSHFRNGPFTLGILSELVRYMAQRNRQIGWMLDFLQTGNDEHVRHARAGQELTNGQPGAQPPRRGTSFSLGQQMGQHAPQTPADLSRSRSGGNRSRKRST
jgi:hypothetical protein